MYVCFGKYSDLLLFKEMLAFSDGTNFVCKFIIFLNSKTCLLLHVHC